MPETARKTKWYSTGGPWGTGLLCLGVAVTVQGAAYVASTPADLRTQHPLQWADHVVPIAGWGLLWIAAGLWSIWQALTPPQRHMDILPAVAVICLWSGLWAGFWLYTGLADGHWSRDWTGAVAWGSLAAVLIFFGRCSNPLRRRR